MNWLLSHITPPRLLWGYVAAAVLAIGAEYASTYKAITLPFTPLNALLEVTGVLSFVVTVLVLTDLQGVRDRVNVTTIAPTYLSSIEKKIEELNRLLPEENASREELQSTITEIGAIAKRIDRVIDDPDVENEAGNLKKAAAEYTPPNHRENTEDANDAVRVLSEAHGLLGSLSLYIEQSKLER